MWPLRGEENFEMCPTDAGIWCIFLGKFCPYSFMNFSFSEEITTLIQVDKREGEWKRNLGDLPPEKKLKNKQKKKPQIERFRSMIFLNNCPYLLQKFVFVFVCFFFFQRKKY